MIKANIVSGLADLAEAAYIRFPEVGPEGLAGDALKSALANLEDGSPSGQRGHGQRGQVLPFAPQ